MSPVAAPNARSNGHLSDRARARVAYGLAAQRAADYARALVPTHGDQHMRRGEWIRQARRHLIYSHALRDAAVFLELADGATWAEVAEGLGLDEALVRERYEERLARWTAGEPAPAGPRMAEGLAVTMVPPAETDVTWADAEQLDRWFIHTSPPRDVEAQRAIASSGDRPFTRNLRPQG